MRDEEGFKKSGTAADRSYDIRPNNRVIRDNRVMARAPLFMHNLHTAHYLIAHCTLIAR